MNDSIHDPRQGGRPDTRLDSRPDTRPDPRLDPRQDHARDPHYDSRPDPAHDPRVFDSQRTYALDSERDSRQPDPQAPDARLYRSVEYAAAYDPQRRGPTAAAPADMRTGNPNQNDSRLNDLGQRLQQFGSPASQRDNASSTSGAAASPYHGAPLPAGPSSANYSAGEFDRPVTVPLTPVSPVYPTENVPQAYGIPPAFPTQSTLPAANVYMHPSYDSTAEPQHAPHAARPAAATSSAASPQDRPQLPASTDENAAKGGFQRVAQAVRAALPFVQKLLPLLDGNLATTVSALISSQQTAHPPAPQVHVDLEPVERGMTELRKSHGELRTQVAEQGTTLKRVEDQLERVREATDRNTLEQQELVEDVRAVGTRVSRFVLIGVLLLALSVALNVYLLIQIQHIFR